MNAIACDFCGSDSFSIRYSLKDWVTRIDGCFILVECSNCGLLYLNPRPGWDELEKYYPKQYHAYHAPANRSRESLLKWIKNVGWQRRSKAILAHQPEGRLLDIGCATGDFLAEMDHQGEWDCYGVEPVVYAFEIARQKTKAKLVHGTLLEARFPSEFFDVVTLWDVLEHTPNPSETLREAQRILRPGGLLVIRVPDPSSFTGRLFGPYWIAFDAPRHLFGFPKQVLCQYLAKENFTIHNLSYLSSEYFTVWGSLGILFYAVGMKKMARLMNFFAYSTISRVLFAVFFLPLSWFGIGSSPVYFARKKL